MHLCEEGGHVAFTHTCLWRSIMAATISTQACIDVTAMNIALCIAAGGTFGVIGS